MRLIVDTSIFIHANYFIHGRSDSMFLADKSWDQIIGIGIRNFPGSEITLSLDSDNIFRRTIDPNYKSSRDKHPFDRNEINEILSRRSRALVQDHLESDDIIYLFTRKYPDAVIVSNDNDFRLMLDNGRTFFKYREKNSITLTDEEVLIERVKKVCEGCTSDDIPNIKLKRFGVAKIKKYLAEDHIHKSLPYILENFQQSGHIGPWADNYELANYDVDTYKKYLNGIDKFIDSL